MEIFARQGDLVIDKLNKPIEGDLVISNRVVFAGDSSGHPHTLTTSALIRRDGRRTLMRLVEPAEIVHAGGHNAVALPAGDYEVRPLRERGDGADRAVED